MSESSERGRTQEELRALARRLFASQEDERRRVSRELHDDICQKLGVLEIDTEQIEPQIARSPEQALRELEKVRRLIASLTDDVRRLSHRLHPAVIDDLGIAPALRSLVEDYREREQTMATFTAQDLPGSLSVETVTGLYRIAQEALRNVAQHAGKTHVEVLLTGLPGSVRLEVADSGRGFDVREQGSGVGLISMEERAWMMEGKFRIESNLGEGTRVTVDVPLRATVR